jgi:predicted phosphoribosyltransferase
MIFRDRAEAGQRLARHLEKYRGEPGFVLALPRGGVVVGAEVAGELHFPLDVIIVRKIGAPGNPEFGIGAVAETGDYEISEEVVRELWIPRGYIDRAIQAEMEEIRRRARLYREGRPLPAVEGRTVILVDDGVATGHTIRVAAIALRRLNPKLVVIAVPVAPPEAIPRLQEVADDVVCLATPEPFLAVGRFYDRFEQVSDAQVIEILKQFRVEQPQSS